VANSYEHGNEFLSSAKGGEFLEYLSDFTHVRMTVLHGVCCILDYRD
jgi:hypothetical protein